MFKIQVDNINGKTESVYVYGDRPILEELEERNILINHNCRQGHCGSCILRLLVGEVSHQNCLIPLLDGEILACRAMPISDIKITVRDKGQIL